MSNSPIPKFSLLAILVITALPGCFQSSVDSSGGANSIGPFEVETVNLQEDDVWALNRPIVLTFNHPLDPDSIDLTTVMIRPLSPEVTGNPVTGSFEIMAGSDDRTLIFRPRCPTDADNSNGAFVPGGYEYELTLPTNATFGASTLRDTAGHSLSVGLTRHFFSPAPPVETLFIDTVTGPPLLDSVTPMTVPSGLNLFSNPDPIVAIHFNQPIDASPDNLNTSRLTLYYSEGEVGDTGELDFPAMNTLPGELLLYQNCSTTGATVYFQVAGIMPPNRNLQLVVSPLFQDIAGEFNSQPQVTIPEATPSLTDYYVNGPLFDESGGNLETVDEFQDFFLDSSWIADDPLLEFPAADWEIGSVTASFSYTGEQVSSDEDFILSSFQDLELLTDGEFFFDDSSGRPFSMTDGVLYVDDFTIEADALLRGKGSNPLIIYATGTVTVLGTLDVSGENAASPPAITNPLIPELGALGHCGGGDGGSASSSTTSETPRAASGGGAFGIGLGGGGGESSVSWESTDMATYSVDPEGKIAGGGAGGTFALTPPSAITWERWTAETNPLTFDDAGPDIRFDRHTVFQDGLGGYDMTEIAAFFIGGEHGMRGNAWRDANTTEPPSTMGIPGQYGGYGMEEVSRDMDANDKTDGLDPSWTTNPPSGGGAPPYNFGHPTDGPDAGFTNTSVLGSTSSTSDDFWGTRYNGFGTAVATLGELTAPWAGAGGGGSGDSSIVNRIDADADSFLDPFSDFFPDTSFPSGWTKEYYKGAAGGGGGGQLQILAIGPIILGTGTQIKANGGIGQGGESIWGLTQQVSGSGGGSGGHIVIHSATGLDVSALDFTNDPFNVDPSNRPEIIQALGGRRGWTMSELLTLGNGDGDGNSDFMVGRGGAGSDGIVQIHLPEPNSDIAWPTATATQIRDYIRHSVVGGPADTDRLEEMLDLIAEPSPYALIPIFAAKSQLQSEWIDTGLAFLHLDPNGNLGTYPDFANALLQFAGTTGGGDVAVEGEVVSLGPVSVSGSTSEATAQGYQVTLISAESIAGFSADLLRNPSLLEGYEFLPDSANTSSTFRITDASWSGNDLLLSTSVLDGTLASVAAGGWAIHERYFGVRTTGSKNRLPSGAGIEILFDGTDDLLTTTGWSADLSTIRGKRFFRYQITFDMDTTQAGVGLASERPSLEYMKIPFAW